MEDYSQYDLTESDDYLIVNSTCLRNKLGFTSTGQLNAAEAEITKLTMAELFINPVEATFNLKHLQGIHFRLFQDVYEWAGQIRTVEIAKGQAFFLPYRLIESESATVFSQLHAEKLLQGLNKNDFGYRLLPATSVKQCVFLQMVQQAIVKTCCPARGTNRTSQPHHTDSHYPRSRKPRIVDNSCGSHTPY